MIGSCCARRCATCSGSTCRSCAPRSGRGTRSSWPRRSARRAGSARSAPRSRVARRSSRPQWRRLRERTDRPFAINHTIRPFDEEAFEATLRFAPPAISFHVGVFPELVERAHDAGILWIQQVIDRAHAERALAAGADVIVAQGGEAGGHGGWVGTLVLVPEVVDVAGDTPVVAAGGIADGRGLAAALALGAQGALVGTRLLASEEMGVDAAWKQRIVEAGALDAVKVPHSERVLPPYNRPGGPADPRALRTPLIDRLGERPGVGRPGDGRPELLAALREDRAHEYLPFAGQSAALVHDVRPAAEIVRELVAGRRGGAG